MSALRVAIALGALSAGLGYSLVLVARALRSAKRDGSRGWATAAALQNQLNAKEYEEDARIAAIARPFLRELRQDQAVKARRAQEAEHRGSRR